MALRRFLITPPGVITQEFRTPTAVRRGVIAGVVGNVLEWYDFALFGFFAREIGAHFFPAADPTASLLAAFGTFAAGFLMRPVGGALFGWVGDRFGRKQALIWSVLAMAFPSFFIGLLPGAETIGLAAPVLLLLFRLMQGLAVGGEYMASAVFLVEGSQPGRRGWMGSWGPLGASAGTLLGSLAGALVNRVLPPEAVMAYGWRIPFLVGLAVGLGGLAIRRHYVERVPHQAPAKSPLGEAFRHHWRTMLHLVALSRRDRRGLLHRLRLQPPPGWSSRSACPPGPRSRSTPWRWPRTCSCFRPRAGPATGWAGGPSSWSGRVPSPCWPIR